MVNMLVTIFYSILSGRSQSDLLLLIADVAGFELMSCSVDLQTLRHALPQTLQ